MSAKPHTPHRCPPSLAPRGSTGWLLHPVLVPTDPQAVPLPLAPHTLVSCAVPLTPVLGPSRGAADPRALPQLYSSWHSLNKVWTERYARLEEQLQASVSYQETMQVGCWGPTQPDTPHVGLPSNLRHLPILAQGCEGPWGHRGGPWAR